jgi:hypothetical protein
MERKIKVRGRNIKINRSNKTRVRKKKESRVAERKKKKKASREKKKNRGRKAEKARKGLQLQKNCRYRMAYPVFEYGTDIEINSEIHI